MYLPSVMSEKGDLASGCRSKLFGVITINYRRKKFYFISPLSLPPPKYYFPFHPSFSTPFTISIPPSSSPIPPSNPSLPLSPPSSPIPPSLPLSPPSSPIPSLPPPLPSLPPPSLPSLPPSPLYPPSPLPLYPPSLPPPLPSLPLTGFLTGRAICLLNT